MFKAVTGDLWFLSSLGVSCMAGWLFTFSTLFSLNCQTHSQQRGLCRCPKPTLSVSTKNIEYAISIWEAGPTASTPQKVEQAAVKEFTPTGYTCLVKLLLQTSYLGIGPVIWHQSLPSWLPMVLLQCACPRKQVGMC